MELGVQVCLLAYKLFGGSVNHGKPGDSANMFTYMGPKSIQVRVLHDKESVKCGHTCVKESVGCGLSSVYRLWCMVSSSMQRFWTGLPPPSFQGPWTFEQGGSGDGERDRVPVSNTSRGHHSISTHGRVFWGG